MKRVAIVCNKDKPNVTQLAGSIIQILKNWNMQPVADEWLSERLGEPNDGMTPEQQVASSEAVIVLGGDGTLLNVARLLARSNLEIPVLGVNLGRFGFLAEVTVPELHEALESLREGDFETSDRNLLLAEVLGENATILSPALNEVVLNRRLQGRLAVITLFIDGQWGTTHRADGLILSTTTGSTAHSMAAGGPILYPAINAWVVTPICPHTLGVRALVIPDSAVVDMRSEQSEVELQITVDGQEQYCLPAGHTLRIRKHPACFKLITSKRRTFYEILREKFNWGDVWQMPSEKC